MSRSRYGHLRYHGETGRYELDGWELHCGDAFQVHSGEKWIDTRIEMVGNDWYLVGLNTSTIDGLEARSHT
jgi:hypothetical protein